MSPRSIAILGSTGSIGVSTLDLLEKSGAEVRIEALAAGRNVALLAEQALRWRPWWLQGLFCRARGSTVR